MPWLQNYAPLGGVGVSAVVAALPVVVLLALLAFWHVRAQIAALAGLLIAGAIAVGVFGMPWPLTVAAAGYGAAFGLFPIGWIILNAIFIYDLSVESGQFKVLQGQIAGLSGDRRIQALLIAFSFGAFIEGAAGFGAPVAISGALMIGLGFRPLEAAKLALIGNTAPVAYGALGTPLITLARITDLDLQALSSMVGRQLPAFSILVPFWLVVAQCGWRGMLGVWPACLVTGGAFGITQFLVSNYHGPWLVDIIASIVSMGALVGLMKVWKPAREEVGSNTEAGHAAGFATTTAERGAAPDARPGIDAGRNEAARGGKVSSPSDEGVTRKGAASGRRPWIAWIPWVFLSVCVFFWGLPVVKEFLNSLFAPSYEAPILHRAVMKMPPLVPAPEAEAAVFAFNLLSATGTALLVAGVLSGFCLGFGPGKLLVFYFRTFQRVRVSLLTIALMLALGFTTRYSGIDTTMGLAMAGTGWFFPFFSPIIGWLGVALTGSDTASNVLFGNLQKVSAQQLGLSPILMAASNSSGGVMGKMIDAQSIVVASVATGGHPDSPDAGTVLRAVFWHSVALAVLMGLLVMLQAYVWPQVIPAN